MLSAGSAFDLSITLDVAGIDTAVTVVADMLALETARSQIVGTVPQAEVQNLPMNGRNFLDLALLVPGVSPTNTNSTQLFAETSAVPGQGLSIASQRNLSNSFIVDGVSANDDAAGLSGIPFGVDAIEQFQVVTGGGQAELGRALGGYVNVVTKSGTNSAARHGLQLLPRRRLQRQERVDQTPRCRWTSSSSAAASAVRCVRNRTFYFANVERKLLDQTGVVTILPENVTIINARLLAGRLPGPAGRHRYLSESGAQHERARQDRSSVQRRRSTERSLCALRRRLRQRSRCRHAERAVGFDRTRQHRSVDRRRQRLDALVEHGQRNARPGGARRSQGLFDRSDRPAGVISGVATFGTFSSSPTRRENTMFQVVNNLSHRAGSHALRAGVDFLYNDDTITFLRTFRGSYTFSSLANFLTGNYNGFAQTFGDPVVNQTNPNLGFYAQDEWRASSRLTLNLGLRYDLQFLETINTDSNNVSPRVGFVWAPTASQDFLVRGGAGVFFDRVPLRAVANALLSAGNTTDVTQLRQPQVTGILPTQAGAPVFPNILPDRLPSTALVSITTMDKDLQNAYSKQANIEVERALGGGRVVTVGLSVLPRREPADVDQPERADVRGGRHEQRLSAGRRLHEQQPVAWRRRLELPRPAPDLPAASEGLVFRPRHLHAVEVDEQPRRGVLQCADRSRPTS